MEIPLLRLYKVENNNMSENNLKALNTAINIYGNSFDAITLAKSYLGTTANLAAKDILTLLHKVNFHAFLIDPKKDISYPTLFWKDDVIIAITVDGRDTVTLCDEESSIMDKKDFLEQHTPEFAICIPPKEDKNPSAACLFWSSFGDIKGLHVELLLIGLFVNLFALGLPLYTLSVYDRVLPTFATSTLWALTIGIIIVLFLDFLFKIQKVKLLNYAQAYIAAKHDESLLDKFLKQRNINISSGEQLEFFHLIQGAREAVLLSILPAIADAPFILLFLGIIYLLAPPLVIVPIILIAIVLLVQGFMVPKANTLAKK